MYKRQETGCAQSPFSLNIQLYTEQDQSMLQKNCMFRFLDDNLHQRVAYMTICLLRKGSFKAWQDDEQKGKRLDGI